MQVRKLSKAYKNDRSLANEIEALAQEIEKGKFCDYAKTILPSMTY